VLVVTVLKMFTRTRNRVTSRAIRPGITSIGMRKEIQETITNMPDNGHNYWRNGYHEHCLVWFEKYGPSTPFGRATEEEKQTNGLRSTK
jgi:hypothetical protein